MGEGGQAKVFKAKFHGKSVAMKYIPLDQVKDDYKYCVGSYGCHEFFYQEKFLIEKVYKVVTAQRILSSAVQIELQYRLIVALKSPWPTFSGKK